ncbi:MAG: SulP family inorganic anion transporter [Devosiaceae bacterium]
MASWVTVGAVQGFDTLTMALALGALFFVGPLAEGYGLGIGTIVLGSALITAFVAARSTLPSSIAHAQETTVAVVATAVMAAAMQGTGGQGLNIATALAIIGASSLVTGVSFWLAGTFKLGGLVRFLPYPVVAGFLAGTGWLLIDGANIVLTGAPLGPESAHAFGEPEVLLRYGLALTLALILIATLNRFANPFVLAGVILGAGALFALALLALGVSIEDARIAGLLPALTGTSSVELPSPALLSQVDWAIVLTFAPLFLAVSVLNLVGFILNMTGLEVALGRDMDLNAELRSTGIANVLAGGVGGSPGYLGLSMTLLSEQVGAHSRLVGLTASAILVLAVLFAGELLFLVPVFMTSGMLLFLGIGLLYNWLIATRKQMALSEWLIIVVILLTIALVGFMEGMAVGLLVSSAMFVFNYARLPVAKRNGTLAQVRSTVDRSPQERALLSDQGAQTSIVQLQGYLFFGTAERVINLVRDRVADPKKPPARRFIIDFSDVSGADSAAASSFQKIEKLATQSALDIVFVHMSDLMVSQLKALGITFAAPSPFRLEAEFDQALEHAEEAILADASETRDGQSLRDFFVSLVGDQADLDALIEVLEAQTLEPGHKLIKAGDTSTDIFFVESGRVSVRVAREDGSMMRVRTMVAGAIVGEMALYAGQARSADVVVDTQSQIYVLSAETLISMEENTPVLAALIHRILASSLAEKLATTNQALMAR